MTDKKELTPIGYVTGDDNTESSRRSSKKLSRQNSLEEYTSEPKKKYCPDYFGVRSYLHHFYDGSSFKDPHIYEDETTAYLLPTHRHSRRCQSFWWKIFTWVGVNMLVFGTVGILVGYLVPQKEVIVRTDATERIVTIDRAAISHNYLLDMSKVIGLVLFSVGGVTLAAALLFPSFLSKYCDDDVYSDDSASILMRYGDNSTTPLTPVEFVTMPASTEVASVQPTRKDDAFVTRDGMVKFKD